ncbi:glycoside hydrolase family 16 protein [Crepidotus variabilis]|uniref:Glycoside hydrolase family 16 protein n=1 Tax=Crepidotus variabilis TaxID=179855 RepID=A0A9P6EFE9_9AGAR|nr:glycoside hydrolase family 16 protein [Crepidotus variabilis]
MTGIPWLLHGLLVLSCLISDASAIYTPLREYAGNTFFDNWAYYGNVDNTTWGNVTFVDKDAATQKKLTYVNDAGNAVVKVDDLTTIAPAQLVNRDTIRLTSLHSYGVGTLILIDAVHIPYGCSVWPSFWTYGIEQEWPLAGEIDIIEGINGMENNQVALHALGGCLKAEVPGQQTGVTIEGDCSKPQGCLVAETKPNSFGMGFAKAGGGVFALQMEESGIYSWFWSRPDIPANVQNGQFSSQSIDTSRWGIPSAGYPSSRCNITQFFPPQNLVLLTTLCGVWAGNPSIYQQTCKTPTNSCVADNIIGPGDKFATAYWEIRYIRTYTNNNATSQSPSDSTSKGPSVITKTVTVSATVQDTAATSNGAHAQRHKPLGMLWILYCLVFFWR